MTNALRNKALFIGLLALSACTQDFDQFRGEGGTGTGAGGGGDACLNVTCDDGNPCTQDSCDNGTCVFTPGVATFPDPNDCVDQICEDGVLKVINDDSETPTDMNACTTDACSGGMPVFTPVAEGTSCNGTGFCDDMGNCSACTTPEQCGTDMPCGTRTCENNTCGWAYTAAGTVVGGVGDGDCMVQECNGTSEQPDTVQGADPDDDMNDCTTDVCNGATTDHNPVAANTMCDDGAASGNGQCNAMGACLDCTTAAGCTGMDVCNMNMCCTPIAMATACMGKNCGSASNGCGGTYNCGTCSGNTPICSATQVCVQCNMASQCATNTNGHACNMNACGCTTGADCTSPSLGPTCLGAGTCGCTMPAECAAHPRGALCNGGSCGCSVNGDCTASTNGKACLGSGVCGCVNNGDCSGLPGSCVGGVCQ